MFVRSFIFVVNGQTATSKFYKVM